MLEIGKMIIISHRGNIHGPLSETENKPSTIDLALELGFDVEIDVWVVDGILYLGHDKPITKVSLEYLKDRHLHLWIHLKNFGAADYFAGNVDFNYFAHENDPYLITSKGYVWSFPGKCKAQHKVVLMPEWGAEDSISGAAGVCTDFPVKYQFLVEGSLKNKVNNGF